MLVICSFNNGNHIPPQKNSTHPPPLTINKPRTAAENFPHPPAPFIYKHL